MAQSATTDSDSTEPVPESESESDVGYVPDYADRERADVGAALQAKAITDPALSVEGRSEEGADGLVTVRFHDSILSGKLLLEPETADWLADQLRDRAAAARGE